MTTVEAPYVAVIYPAKTFRGPVTDWFTATGAQLVPVPPGDDRMPRFAIHPQTADNLKAVLPKADLTAREMQVLTGMAAGMSNAAIGRQLYVSEDTIKTHARRLFRKLGVNERAGAVGVGFRRGLLR